MQALSTGRFLAVALLLAVCLASSLSSASGWCTGGDPFCSDNWSGTRYRCGAQYDCKMKAGGGLSSDGGFECTCILKGGIIAGIVIGCVAFAAVVCGLTICFFRRRHLRAMARKAEEDARRAREIQASRPAAPGQPADPWVPSQPTIAYGQPVGLSPAMAQQPQLMVAPPVYPQVQSSVNPPPYAQPVAPPAPSAPFYPPPPYSGGYVSEAALANACKRCGFVGDGARFTAFCTSCGAPKPAPQAVTPVTSF